WALAGHGMSLCLSGRDVGRLEDVATEVRARAAQVLVYAADLWTDEARTKSLYSPGGSRGFVSLRSTRRRSGRCRSVTRRSPRAGRCFPPMADARSVISEGDRVCPALAW